MNVLSDDALCIIFGFLDQRDLYTCMQVSARWRRLLTEGSGAIFGTETFTRSLLCKDIRLDTLREWRLVYTPMIAVKEEKYFWKYGHAFCYRTHSQAAGVITAPFCNSSTQKAIYRRGAELGLISPVISSTRQAPDMPLLSTRHRMQKPALVQSIRLVVILKMCLQNFANLYFEKAPVSNAKASEYNVLGLLCTKVVVEMEPLKVSPMENTTEVFRKLQEIITDFPSELVHRKWIEADAWVPKLPTKEIAPLEKSSFIVRIMPFQRHETRARVDQCIARISENVKRLADKWIEEGMPWESFNIETAMIAAFWYMNKSNAHTPTAPKQVALILLSRQKRYVESYCKCMRYHGFCPEDIRLNEDLLMHIFVVFYYFCKTNVDYENRVENMQKLAEAIHSGRFLVGKMALKLDSEAFQSDFRQYLAAMKEFVPDAVFSVYSSHARNIINML